MVSATVGDRVVCKIKDAEIVAAGEAYDEKHTFEIIGISYQGWYVYIPPYITVKNTIPITERNCKSLGIDPKFIGWDAYFITGSFLLSVQSRAQGVVCFKCNEYFEWAEPNQEDGTMICWSCSTYPKYKSNCEDDDY